MTVITVSVDRRRQRDLLRNLRRLERFNPLSLHEEIGRSTESLVSLTFVRERDPYDVPWLPLSESTVRSRRRGRTRGAARILRDTARLFSSVGYSANRRFVDVGVADQKGIFHQEGTKFIPRRAFLPYDRSRGTDGFPRDWTDRVERAAQNFLQRLGFVGRF